MDHTDPFDEEELCPVCAEPFDLTDKGFKPCSCGFQICVWCWHKLLEQGNSKCPACRRPYESSKYEFKMPSADSLSSTSSYSSSSSSFPSSSASASSSAAMMNSNSAHAAYFSGSSASASTSFASASSKTGQSKSKATANSSASSSKKGTSKTSASSSSSSSTTTTNTTTASSLTTTTTRGTLYNFSEEERKHLANVRVVQRNLVYVVGLPDKFAKEEILKSHEWFGQYGTVLKVVTSHPPAQLTAAQTAQAATTAAATNANANAANNPSLSNWVSKMKGTVAVYVTFTKEEEALTCISVVDGLLLDEKPLKASFGTTKYCAFFLRAGKPCSNPECMYLHEIGSPRDTFSKEEMIISKHLFQAAIHPNDPAGDSVHPPLSAKSSVGLPPPPPSILAKYQDHSSPVPTPGSAKSSVVVLPAPTKPAWKIPSQKKETPPTEAWPQITDKPPISPTTAPSAAAVPPSPTGPLPLNGTTPNGGTHTSKKTEKEKASVLPATAMWGSATKAPSKSTNNKDNDTKDRKQTKESGKSNNKQSSESAPTSKSASSKSKTENKANKSQHATSNSIPISSSASSASASSASSRSKTSKSVSPTGTTPATHESGSLGTVSASSGSSPPRSPYSTSTNPESGVQPSSHSGSDYGFEEEDESRYLESMDEELQDVRQIHMAHTTVRGLPENRIDSGAFDAANVAQFDWNSFMSSVLNFSVDPLRDDPHDFPVGETSVISGLLPAAAAAVAAAAATAGGTDLASELQLDKQITMSVLHSTQQTKKQSRFQTLFGFDSESTESESDAVSASAALANNNNNNLNMNNNHNSNNNHAAHTQTNNTFSFLGESSWPSSNIVFPFL